MSSILDKLLKGQKVEWVALGEISTLYGGLTGKTKNDFGKGNAKYIPYKNIFSNLAVDKNNLETVAISNHEKQNFLKYGDVLFTGSSESREEAGLSSVVTFNLDEKIYLNSFSFGLRFNDDINLNPEFTKYLFRGNAIRNEIAKSASGVTRYNISKASFRKIQIPIPSLDVQAKIVKILDAFTALTAELTAELTMREKQYHYYRDKLLTFSDDEVEWKILGEITNYEQPSKYLVESTLYNDNFNTPVLTAGKTFILGYTDEINGIYKASSSPVIIFDDFTTANKWVDFDFKAKSSAMKMITSKDDSLYLLKFIYYWLNSLHEEDNSDHKRQWISNFANKRIPVPSINEQKRIVAILDKLHTLANSITEGLPKEIALRQKQYEYYREQLLDFPKS